MTQNEISKLKAAFTKLLVNEPEVVNEGSLFGPFEGVKLQKDEYEIIEPFLFLMRDSTYKIGSVTLTVNDSLHVSCHGSSEYVWVKIPKISLVFLNDVIEFLIMQEQFGHHIKFANFTKQED